MLDTFYGFYTPGSQSKKVVGGISDDVMERLHRHASWLDFLATEQPNPQRLFAFTTRGMQAFANATWQAGDWLVFGSETAGLPAEVLEGIAAPQQLRLPMRPGQRSLNLSNSVAVTVFEAWRQNGYAGGS